MSEFAEWHGLRTLLVVAKDGIDARNVAEVVGLGLEMLLDGSGGEWGPGTLAWNFSKEPEEELEASVLRLVAHVRSRLGAVHELLRDGHAVHVDVVGMVETGSTMTVAPELLAELASLGVPLTFTALSGVGAPEADPLDWLDG